MNVIMEGNTPIKIWCEDPEESAVEQLRRVARLPFIFKHVAAMPDVHWGMGATVGSVIATEGAVVPSAVGVDIGCGMMALNLGVQATELRSRSVEIRKAIETRVPVGFNSHKEPLEAARAWGKWVRMPLYKPDHERGQKALHQMGTLGGGNHFIEICEDETGISWAMLHSGSRGFGKHMADFHMNRAKEECAKWFVQLPDKDLAYLAEGTTEFDDYMSAVMWCQDYAWRNREIMMEQIASAFIEDLGIMVQHPGFALAELVHCHHNYVTREAHFGRNVWLTRKGAVCARAGMKGIIPGSMGAKSYIVEGLGNPESFNSCSHGAGRKMGRNEAKRTFTVADLAEQTKGVECRKDDGVLDEIPGSYKDIDVVMANQTDLVKPIHTLKQFLCIKG